MKLNFDSEHFPTLVKLIYEERRLVELVGEYEYPPTSVKLGAVEVSDPDDALAVIAIMKRQIAGKRRDIEQLLGELAS